MGRYSAESNVCNIFKRNAFGHFIQKADKLLCGDFLFLYGFENLLVFKLCDFGIVLGNALVDYLPLILVGGFLLPKPVTSFIALLQFFLISTLRLCRLGLIFGSRLVVEGTGRTFVKVPMWLAVLACVASIRLAVLTALLVVLFGMRVRVVKA